MLSIVGKHLGIWRVGAYSSQLACSVVQMMDVEQSYFLGTAAISSCSFPVSTLINIIGNCQGTEEAYVRSAWKCASIKEPQRNYPFSPSQTTALLSIYISTVVKLMLIRSKRLIFRDWFVTSCINVFLQMQRNTRSFNYECEIQKMMLLGILLSAQ